MSKPSRARRFRVWGRVESLETRALMTIAVTAPLPDVAAPAGSAAATVDLGAHFQDPDGKADFAVFNTTHGTIPVLLTPATTPKTVANFLNYVNKGAYANSIVHRSVPGFVWQAGGFRLNSTPGIEQTPADSPVQNEFGASNTRGTIAMAKLGNDPNSATSQFFFNLSDSNAANLDNQNGGFTVFGRVVGQSGLAVMDSIAATPVPAPGPYASPLDSIPLMNYKAGSAVQLENLVLIKDVTTADRAYSAVSDAPNVAAATLRGDKLVVTPLAAGTATVTVVGHGADGSTAAASFTVHVTPGGAPPTPPPPPPPR
ncbi:peptidylprolyl isomerase, partial [Paludisphaera sp.]|uniref:peptidylprolyl isomerase n=1 Tax=Paludisphaera sp. TaxID=2017432 RepID=UPI00301CDE24